MAERESTQERFEIVGFEGGRRGRAIIETDHGWVRMSAAELMGSAGFAMLPADEQARVRWLAERAGVQP